ncbi:ABC transporter permease subunit [Phytohalomonas tamaricis]|uniref:ABC transporter permease subunit n=1 Tax=Phytohalomonas tamaricis TaxID=2081032 RepID=UPI000D0AF735|nr:ABC transporter permease subunit [Phytohalomonas tamaricis]
MTQLSSQPPAAASETAEATTLPAATSHPLIELWHAFRENHAALAGLIIILLIFVAAIGADFIAPHAPTEQFRDYVLVPPFWQEGGSIRFLLGTDDVGRDILSRIIYGARLSMLIGLIVVSLSLVTGVLLGLLAGFLRGVVETVIMRLMDIMLAIPSLLLAVVVVAVLGPGLFNAMLAIAVVYLPHYVRLTRGSVISERDRDYVIASRLAGAGLFRLMFITVLPNCLAPLIVQATLGFSNAVLDAAALGFLGLGAQPPTPEWGSMLADARQYVLDAWWVVTFPGLAILITVLAFNIMGDGLRDALDPKLKR